MDTSPKRMRQLLKENGWVLDRIKGSHHIYINKVSGRTIPVPFHGNKDLKIGTFMGILRILNIKNI